VDRYMMGMERRTMGEGQRAKGEGRRAKGKGHGEGVGIEVHFVPSVAPCIDFSYPTHLRATSYEFRLSAG
jgi:hypothetical protein